MWPMLLLVVLAFVVVDFVRHPSLGESSDAAVAPRAHLTVWLAETEASNESGQLIHATAGSLRLYGRPATIGLLPGGASHAVVSFLGRRQPANQLLAVSSETLADLAQERTSALLGEDPQRAAFAQRLLAHAVPIEVLEGQPMTIAVPDQRGSDLPVRNVGDLLAQLRRSAQALVFAITDGNWDTDNLAALVQDAGADGVVPYRVYPSAQDASLALAAGSADAVLAPRDALLPDIRADRLRALAWPTATLGPPPRLWVELIAAPGTPAARIDALRRQLRALTGNSIWRGLPSTGRYGPDPLSGARLRGFLPAQMTQITGLQQVAQRVERH